MKTCRIGDVARVQSGFAFKSMDFRREGVKLLRNTNILPLSIYWDDLACLDATEYERHSAYQLRPGDLILSLDRPIISTGIKVARIEERDVPALLVQRVGRIRFDGSKVDAAYLYLFLQSSRFVAGVGGHEQSIGVPHVSPSQVEAIELPLPELVEQQKIATRLKAQLAEVEIARQAAQTQLQELTQLANAIVAESIQRRATSSHLLGDVLGEVKMGIGPNWASYPVLGVTRGGLAPAKEQSGKLASKYKPAFPGTVFYNPMRILIGSIAYVDDDDTPGITIPDYVALQGKEGFVDSRWFYYWLRSPMGAHCILSLARGAVRERMLFNRLAEGKIELPSFAVQERASHALRELKSLRVAMERRLQDIDLLPKKILAQAFNAQGDHHG